ncbi:SDR family oxidoreductase [Mucilaginibacter terrae]|uniref:NAD(P)-dependent dehydrogenase (Short-subunit alcohol dehydrogenase family) n=1 Tax=Mucilaginibacter terrae TaxID=1955052 RepID=A0ABU3H147_9SPHI|nr:SDR family oxidoreductase [Mucilaginibacter terrae]MDT3405441.1 NAD(P)-dependent dehydrogenase (short-subunit alcohol dehydrogenase family) [Mucilaginibacter terrae]
MNTYDLKDKVILIAGGSSGMGLALAQKAADYGATVHLVGTNQEKLQKEVETIKAKGNATVHIFTHILDISNESEVKELAEQIQQLDHLVTTAARLTFKPLADLTKTEIGHMIDSKLWGPILLTKYLFPKIDSQGSIVYFSGVAADKGSAGASIVGAVNSALHGLAKNLVYELSPVRVNVVSPGLVESPTWDFIGENDRPGFYETAAEGLPAKRIGQPEDLADAALYLMNNKYTNGTVLTVDGGANA